MLRALIEMADTLGLPIYFETQTEGNVVFYKKFGFEIFTALIPQAQPPMLKIKYN